MPLARYGLPRDASADATIAPQQVTAIEANFGSKRAVLFGKATYFDRSLDSYAVPSGRLERLDNLSSPSHWFDGGVSRRYSSLLARPTNCFTRSSEP